MSKQTQIQSNIDQNTMDFILKIVSFIVTCAPQGGRFQLPHQVRLQETINLAHRTRDPSVACPL